MGVRRGGMGICPPGNWDYETISFRKSEVRSSIPNDWMKFLHWQFICWYDTHCTRARFTILASCSGEFTVQSCPLFFLQRHVARLGNWQAHCFILVLYCVTITSQQIFKGSLQIMVKGVLPHVTVERNHLVAYSGIASNFILCEKSMGKPVAMLPQVWKIHC